MSDIQEIIQTLQQFNQDRDWDKFHNPKDLSLAISIEAGELLELFLWKNGYGNAITGQKFKVIKQFYGKIDVLKQLRVNFSWDFFENEFQPAKSSTIWKIFLLHLINPKEFPIFDQHVYRFLNFQNSGKIVEISNNPRVKYESYKLDYLPWFNKIQQEYQLDPKQMDQSFMSFGQLLKQLKGLPINITF